ncbi:MAG: hypothetical protein A2007_01925 [Verrucomicrobia bacterium GWC2_42_7]|nr:MAG: hypothetical protein A2007_01925 [Verrucomicrobia bacterium GWC2_42_7]
MIIRVCGRASYLNSMPLGDLFKWMFSSGSSRCIIDFEVCTGIDSTFLGILAGLALELRRQNRLSDCQLCNLNERNYELIQNMGLDRIFKVSRETLIKGNDSDWVHVSGLENQRPTKEMILKAHENLLAINGSNKNKFEDVITFLQRQNGSLNKIR